MTFLERGCFNECYFIAERREQREREREEQERAEKEKRRKEKERRRAEEEAKRKADEARKKAKAEEDAKRSNSEGSFGLSESEAEQYVVRKCIDVRGEKPFRTFLIQWDGYAT